MGYTMHNQTHELPVVPEYSTFGCVKQKVHSFIWVYASPIALVGWLSW